MLFNATIWLETVRNELRIVLHKSEKNENNPIGLESASKNLEDMKESSVQLDPLNHS
jgi:hypothetical protein